ncbi:type II secretion system protein [Deinococcus wulumuqiensis]|uniref:Prepilin-type N-terminal cleavage/methylation domain-containing protein n=1 Tax=Deinococcus wulumuqiensis TaxID=980427 RepID=A0AAV4K8T3_9DEIO|nr:prepilin-type N-terminal cleavage/methylation domain-containing protein [Deinococcus wulumuqiensis]QII22477.1 prepilin-type N-terminal cleavage/methylation domain-containing protein [Deinococcus wulumuqiensis R12]GGI87884.1 hypothetical protein GCM10010914_22840 [Deinococcus wulumuqiensis]GGP30291.1 hypothetical protein GCM10008021_19420 [Deinococcus wulumuqiensis]
MKSSREGFSLVEVLIAVTLIALVLGSVVASNVRLAEMNSRAEVQTAQASAAEGIAQLYVGDVPADGEVRSGRVSTALPLRAMPEEDKAIWNVLEYRLQRSGNTLTIEISRSDVSPDPNPLRIEVGL